jgi:hypothetical protein
MYREAVRQMSEFQVTDRGQLDLGVDDVPDRRLAGADDGPPPDDDWAEDIWDSGDPESDPDDYEAWLAGLPADIRAEFLAGAWTGAGESIPAGFLHHMRGGPSGAGFASGGILDAMIPGPPLADALAAATAEGHAQLGESELIGVLCAWRRISAWAAAGESAAVVTLASRRGAQSREPRRSDLAEHVIDEDRRRADAHRALRRPAAVRCLGYRSAGRRVRGAEARRDRLGEGERVRR